MRSCVHAMYVKSYQKMEIGMCKLHFALPKQVVPKQVLDKIPEIIDTFKYLYLLRNI